MKFSTKRRPAFAPPARSHRKGATDQAPPGVSLRHTTAALKRRQALMARAAEALECIPAPGESVHTLMAGQYDLMHVVVLLAERLQPIEHIACTTLSFGKRNLVEICGLLDSGQVRRFTLLTSTYFREHHTQVWELALRELHMRKQHVAAIRCHSKVVCLHAAGTKITLEGSANLQSNSGVENLTLVNDAGLCDWYTDWIVEQVAKHEVDNGQEEPGQA